MSDGGDGAPGESESDALGSPFFRLGLLVAFVLLAAMALRVASLETFNRDDFSFLYRVQQPGWNWFDTYLPLEKRWWWAWRPLGMDTYFYLCLKAFGLNSFAFFSVSLAFFFATGPLVYRVARQFGFAAPIAALAGLLAISRHATLNEIFYASDFHYVAAVFFGLVATTLYLDHLRRPRWGCLALSCAGFAAALLCNEFSLIFAVLFAFVSLWASITDAEGVLLPRQPLGPLLLRAAGQAAPYLVIAVAFLIVRFRVIGPAILDVSYRTKWTLGHLYKSMKVQSFFVFGDRPTLWIALLIAAGAIFLIVRHRDRSQVLHWLIPSVAVFVIWTLGGLAPFLVIVNKGARFSTAIEVPICLLFASLLAAVWRLYGRDHRRRFEVALLCLVFAALPYRTLWERSQHLHGKAATNLIAALQQHYPHPEKLKKLILLYNAPDLANLTTFNLFKSYTFGGTSAVWTHYPRSRMGVAFHDLGYMGIRRDCARCGYLQLMPHMEVAAAEDRYFNVKAPSREERRKTFEGKRQRLLEAYEARAAEGS